MSGREAQHPAQPAQNGHMSSYALKHWANGAAFQAQMLFHITCLRKNEGSGFESAKTAAVGAINTYDRDMSDLLKNYKAYRTSSLDSTPEIHVLQDPVVAL
ncbi:hypothetical protein P4O66_002738 [Electrophorus voltai]|uniref:Uncharacterized protein n=1 Tax=Electrophorus voltai TaxID=2609070 RepID=A0AAD9DMS1_9TELE|nr:hypothetical protein P4O66_002738 [Electrophorus voltai]